MAFPTLDALRAHVGVSEGVLTALAGRLGPLGDSIENLAALTPSTVDGAVGAARVIVAATPQTPGHERHIGPLEATQVGSMWRIARRIVYCRNGMNWDEALKYDIDPALPVLPAPAIGGGATLAVATPSPQVSVSKYKTSDYLDPMDDSEFADPTSTQVAG